jgi:hypothetical protein
MEKTQVKAPDTIRRLVASHCLVAALMTPRDPVGADAVLAALEWYLSRGPYQIGARA